MNNLSKKISIAEARQLHENWMATRAQYIEDGLGEPDPFEFVFSAEELREYLEEIIQNSASSNPGIRVYFGAYLNDSGESTATVFFTPTITAEPTSLNDYNMRPMNRGMRGIPPQTLKY